MKNLFVILCFMTLLSACTQVVKPLPLANADRLSIQTVAPVDSAGPMAISGDGQLIAWGDKDLNLLDLQTGRHSQLTKYKPQALCWSPDGSLLAAVVPMDEESHLFIFDRSGSLVHKHHLPGYATRLQWPKSGRLTAAVLSAEAYSFGTHVKGELLQWDGRWRLIKTFLYETTLTPSTVASLAGRLHQTFDFDLSPLEDEVLYTRIHAPPAFAASRRLVLHNLQTGTEKFIAKLPLLEGGGRLAADGETVLLNDNLGWIILKGLWNDKTYSEWPGSRLAYDAGSGLLTTEFAIFQGDEERFKLPEKSRVQLSAGGKFLLIHWQGYLYLVSGYQTDEIGTVTGVKMKKIHKLRRLRSRGLIDQDEYRQARERLLQ